MTIIDSKNTVLKELIKPIDDTYIEELVKVAFSCNKDTETYNLRDELYKSKYKTSNLESKELALESYLNQQQNIKTKHQNKEYNWILINKEYIGPTSSRFYIAPNPENMHEIVKKLTSEFIKQNVPLKFKYQLTTGMEQCDRIIIYSDYENKERIENIIKNVYNNNQELFVGCERATAWLYDTKIPGVYQAPETPNKAYSTKLAETIIEAKETFNYLYGLTDKSPKIVLEGRKAKEAYEYMKIIIPSIMLRNGLLLSKEGKCITLKDKNLNSYYDLKTGIMRRTNTNEFGYYEVNFLPTNEGRLALLENFYNISTIYRQEGITKRYLTLEEKKEELDRILYPHKYTEPQKK